MNIKLSLLTILLTSLFMSCKPPAPPITPTVYTSGEYNVSVFKTSDGRNLNYNLYMPKGDFEAGSLPILLFLHGAGERGADNQLQLKNVALKFATEEFQSQYPSIIIVPQCPENEYWATVDQSDGQWKPVSSGNPTPSMQGVIELMEEVFTRPEIDRKRVYISGLSMGGFGTFDLLSRHPDWFAAAVPICGGADVSLIDKYKDIPMQIFHGKKDPTVPVYLSQAVFGILKSKNAPVTYTEYPEGDHVIWDKAYEGLDLVDWMFDQKNTFLRGDKARQDK